MNVHFDRRRTNLFQKVKKLISVSHLTYLIENVSVPSVFDVLNIHNEKGDGRVSN